MKSFETKNLPELDIVEVGNFDSDHNRHGETFLALVSVSGSGEDRYSVHGLSEDRTETEGPVIGYIFKTGKAWSHDREEGGKVWPSRERALQDLWNKSQS